MDISVYSQNLLLDNDITNEIHLGYPEVRKSFDEDNLYLSRYPK